MDCKEFRNNHSLFVDLRCSALEENEMRQHVRDCPRCSRHDTLVRRSLMLIRSLPTIEPSPDFRARLEARLRSPSFLVVAPRPLRASYASWVALAAGIGFVAYVATGLLRQATPAEIRLPPVVASIPEVEPSPVATPALVATVPTGMSVWPAIVVASQAPFHFVAAEMATER
jgi:hypothetical protein